MKEQKSLSDVSSALLMATEALNEIEQRALYDDRLWVVFVARPNAI